MVATQAMNEPLDEVLMADHHTAPPPTKPALPTPALSEELIHSPSEKLRVSEAKRSELLECLARPMEIAEGNK